MSKNKKYEFMKKIGLKGGECKAKLDYLIQSNSDFDEFILHHYRVNDGNISRAVESYRIHKKKGVNVSLIEFKHLYSVDKVQALEVILQEPIFDQDLHLLNSVNAEDIYREHQNDITHSFVSLINILMERDKNVNQNDLYFLIEV